VLTASYCKDRELSFPCVNGWLVDVVAATTLRNPWDVAPLTLESVKIKYTL